MKSIEFVYAPTFDKMGITCGYKNIKPPMISKEIFHNDYNELIIPLFS